MDFGVSELLPVCVFSQTLTRESRVLSESLSFDASST